MRLLIIFLISILGFAGLWSDVVKSDENRSEIIENNHFNLSFKDSFPVNLNDGLFDVSFETFSKNQLIVEKSPTLFIFNSANNNVSKAIFFDGDNFTKFSLDEKISSNSNLDKLIENNSSLLSCLDIVIIDMKDVSLSSVIPENLEDIFSNSNEGKFLSDFICKYLVKFDRSLSKKFISYKDISVNFY